MNSLLLASACAGSWQELESLVDGQASSSAAIQRASGCDDEEACLRASSTMEGVTVQGDTALHVVASSSSDDGDKFLRSADIIFDKAKDLLFVQNNKGDTPLHRAAQAGNSRMVSRLIGFAKAEHRAKELLETENKLGETALHEAVRAGSSSMVNQLMEEDPELASLPRYGASPLYLAVLFGDKFIAETLHAKSAAGKLSYSGPNGQNALHAGLLRDKVMTEMLLDWKKDLTKQADQNGSTPLHIAASLWGVGVPLKPLLHADPYQMYQPDGEGLFPIHVAATSGSYSTIKTMITEYPETAGLRDSKGRTFIHVAVEWKRSYLVASACRTPSLAWILNMRDNDGNTALHLAVQLGVSDSFCSLLMNTKVRLDLTNNNGETPLDLSWSKKPVGPSYFWNDENLVHHTLKLCQARHGYHLRYDHLVRQQKSEDQVKESNKLTSSTQTLIIGPVLIATVTFGASFTLPGGYKTDGTPTLVGRYIFDAFIMANTLAFLLSTAATINLLYAGMAMAALPIRRGHFNISAYITFCSITSFGAAFVLGTYLILALVAHMTAIAICALAFLVSLFHYKDPLRGIAIARALLPRMGSKAFFVMAHIIALRTLVIYWPLVIIFGWTAISTKYGT